eukprot:TRINITY_DN15189_c0_g1_i7.p1 TRINITY_DN15189_c0_g1~~TRINITY_DN15189_c0_g1_i7.p1  ORF type:complete len:161 (-),score=12.80 TRINITY_DN15189_c0_g1_i7:54-536(-)
MRACKMLADRKRGKITRFAKNDGNQLDSHLTEIPHILKLTIDNDDDTSMAMYIHHVHPPTTTNPHQLQLKYDADKSKHIGNEIYSVTFFTMRWFHLRQWRLCYHRHHAHASHGPPCIACIHRDGTCLLYTSDAADEEDSVDLGGRRIIKKKKKMTRKEQI